MDSGQTAKGEPGVVLVIEGSIDSRPILGSLIGNSFCFDILCLGQLLITFKVGHMLGLQARAGCVDSEGGRS